MARGRTVSYCFSPVKRRLTVPVLLCHRPVGVGSVKETAERSQSDASLHAYHCAVRDLLRLISIRSKVDDGEQHR